jgi:hypothetical protein
MRIISLFLAGLGVLQISAYVITAPVYAVRRNVDGGSRAIRAREDQLRRRLLSRSRSQKTFHDEEVILEKYREGEGGLDICEASTCDLTDGMVVAERLSSLWDDENDDDEEEKLHSTDSSFPMPAWVSISSKEICCTVLILL